MPAEMIGGKLAEPTEAEALARAKFSTRGLKIALAHARSQGLGLVLLALVALFALRAPGFATLDNVGDVLRDLSILGILAIGETFVMIGGGIDLSVGSVLLLAGIVSDDLIRLEEVSTGVTIPVALVVGCLVGAFNGLLVTRLRLSAFIVTLATLYIVRGVGLSLYSSDVHNLQGAIISDDNFLILGQGDVFGIPVSFIVFAVLLGIGTFVLRRTGFGLHLYAVGGNELAARLTRIRVGRIQLISYVIAGFCSALAGIVLTSRLQTGAPEAGLGEEFDVIAAVIIGGASLFGGRGTLIGTLVGAAFITVLAKGQTLIGVPSNYQSFTRGLVILIAVGLDVMSQRGITSPHRVRWARILNRAPPNLPEHARPLASVTQTRAGVPVLRAVGLRKSFIEIHAVDGIDFDVHSGEIHAIVGENGAGKSTLIKMLAGVFAPDSGHIEIGGQTAVFHDVADAQDYGIAVIYQERAVVPELTGAQNIMLGHEPLYRLFGLIDRTALRQNAQRIWSLLGSPASLDAPARELGPSLQQLVDIARALSFDARVVIMDEPTAALTQEETRRLFGIVRDLKRRGTAVIYISHDLEEIFEIADRVTVLRDGRLVRTLPVTQVTRSALIRMMIGREIEETGPRDVNRQGPVALSVTALRRAGVLDGISFEVRAGEVLGIAGLVGSGRTELLRAIFGADRIDGGEIWLHGKRYSPHAPSDAIGAGIGFIPEDRKSEGLVPAFTIGENLSLPNYDLVSTASTWLDAGREERLATRLITTFKIDPPVPRWRTNHLSGGNQQKVVLAKWLARKPKLLLVDEPTHGVDVGAREEIYRVIEDLARAGTAVIVVSSYLPEVLRISDRLLVMRDGRIALEVDRPSANEEMLLEAATRGAA